MTIGIIGNGRFGNLVYKTVKSHLRQGYDEQTKTGREVRIFSRKKKVDNNVFFSLKDVASCDIVIPCTPISIFEETIKSISPFLKADSLVIDVCSVKIHPVKIMELYIPGNVSILATHPMFGPDSTQNGTTFKDLKLIYKVIRGHRSGRIESILNFFESLELNVIELTPEEHDKQAAYSHAYAFLVGKIGQNMGIKDQQVTTKGFNLLLENQKAVENDTDQLFKDMFEYNPYVKEMLEDFNSALEKINLQFNAIS